MQQQSPGANAPATSPVIPPGHFLAQVSHMPHQERGAVAVVGLVLLSALNTGRLLIEDRNLENSIYAFQDAIYSTIEVEALAGAALAVCACVEGVEA